MDEHTERRAERAYAEFQRTRGPRAMAEVFDLTAGELLLFARRLARDAAAAEDLVQQTFVRAIERADQFEPTRRLLPWLMAILTNEARMVRRRGEPDLARMRHREVEEPPAEAARHEAARAMQAAFAELPPPCLDVVAMRFLHDMKPRRIAVVLAIPVATVKTRLRRGVQQLAANLPPGLAFAAAISLLAGRGMAATRRAVVAHAGQFAFSTAVWSLWGIVTMKKIAIAVGAALALASLLLWWNHESPPPTAAPAGLTGAAATARIDDEVAAPSTPAERLAVSTAEPLTTSPAAAAEVLVDLSVRAIWKQSRQPAARVPLLLLVQPSDCLAHQWTDQSGQARFVVSVPLRHWPQMARERSLSVTTPLLPGRFFNLVSTSDPSTLVVELDDGQQAAGSVVDAAGNPVVGADVRLAYSEYADSVVARSDAAGEFELAGLPVGYTLRASAGAMESAPATIADLVGGKLLLRLDRGGDVLQIRVVANEHPVADATVRIDTGWRFKAPRRRFLGSTDAEGLTTFAGVPADSYVIEVVHRTHAPAQRRITTEGLGASRVETIPLDESATLVGTVRRGKQPASYMQVTLEQADSLFHRPGIGTDRNGRFRAERLAVGTHEVFFASDGTNVRRIVTLHAGEQSVAFDLPGVASIAGRLLFADGSPAPGWKVAAQPTDEMAGDSRAVTDALGKFSCNNLPDGCYRLVATGPDGGGHTFFGHRPDGPAVDCRLPTTALWRSASIVGRVENPPADATLWMSDGNGNGGHGSALASTGTIAIDALAPGRHRLWLECDGVVCWLTEVELTSAQVCDLGVVRLPRCGALVVTLRDPAGVGAKDAYVMLRSAATTGGGSFGPWPRVGADGAWHCEGVPSGNWWLIVGGEGLAPVVREVLVEGDSTQRIEVELAAATTVTVRYTAADADARTVGWRRETVRRVGDRAIVLVRELIGPLESRLDLALGSYSIEIETGGGFHGVAAFDAPTAVPVEVPLLHW